MSKPVLFAAVALFAVTAACSGGGSTDGGTDAGGGQCRLGGDCDPAADAGLGFCGVGCAANCIFPAGGGGRFCSLPCNTNADCGTPYGCCTNEDGGLTRKMCMIDRAGCP